MTDKSTPENGGAALEALRRELDTLDDNLIELLNQALLIEPDWASLHADLTVLNWFSVDYRYPGLFATKPQAQDAVKRCRTVRRIIRQSFGLPV